MDTHKPAGYTTVSPYLIVTDAASSIAFLSEVLGAVEIRRSSDDAGRVRHAELRIDDSILMVADGFPPEWPAMPAHVHVYVRDVDDTYHRALKAGAVSVQAPSQKGDEDRRSGVRDAGGTTWWIATRVG